RHATDVSSGKPGLFPLGCRLFHEWHGSAPVRVFGSGSRGRGNTVRAIPSLHCIRVRSDRCNHGGPGDRIRPEEQAHPVTDGTGAHLAPAIPYGVCTTSRPYPGTVSVSVDALKAFVGDVLADFTRNGVRRIMIVSGHAGREHMMALRAAAQEVVDRGSGLRATV